MSTRTRVLTLIIAAVFSTGAGAANVIVGATEWRQLTETEDFTWNEVAAACPQDGTPCTGAIVRGTDGTSVDVTGWTWARNTDVRALFDVIIQPTVVNFANEFSAYSLVDDPDIHRVLTDSNWFEPTVEQPAYGDFNRHLFGWSATTYGTKNAYVPQLTDLTLGQLDAARLGSIQSRTYRTYLGTYTMGVWLFRPYSGGPLKSLTLDKSETAGCLKATGTVTLSAAAPAEGVVVNLTDTLASARTVATMKILSGATSKTFSVLTDPVSVSESGTVSATVGGQILSQPLKVVPMGLSSIALTPTTVVGGKLSTGTAKLQCKAGPGPVEVGLASSNGTVASPVAPSIIVSQGVQSVTFDVSTNPVLAKATAAISGTANGVTKSRTLTVTTAASVIPTSLKFYSQVVYTTSGVLNAILYNKSALPYSILGITLTGTGATHYARISNCGATLAAGASCTIGVTFTPRTTGSKSAKLNIATSATSSPLSVALSGTGVL